MRIERLSNAVLIVRLNRSMKAFSHGDRGDVLKDSYPNSCKISGKHFLNAPKIRRMGLATDKSETYSKIEDVFCIALAIGLAFSMIMNIAWRLCPWMFYLSLAMKNQMSIKNQFNFSVSQQKYWLAYLWDTLNSVGIQ